MFNLLTGRCLAVPHTRSNVTPFARWYNAPKIVCKCGLRICRAKGSMFCQVASGVSEANPAIAALSEHLGNWVRWVAYWAICKTRKCVLAMLGEEFRVRAEISTNSKCPCSHLGKWVLHVVSGIMIGIAIRACVYSHHPTYIMGDGREFMPRGNQFWCRFILATAAFYP